MLGKLLFYHQTTLLPILSMTIKNCKIMLVKCLTHIWGQYEVILVLFVCIVDAKTLTSWICKPCDHIAIKNLCIFVILRLFKFDQFERVWLRILNSVIIIDSLIRWDTSHHHIVGKQSDCVLVLWVILRTLRLRLILVAVIVDWASYLTSCWWRHEILSLVEWIYFSLVLTVHLRWPLIFSNNTIYNLHLICIVICSQLLMILSFLWSYPTIWITIILHQWILLNTFDSCLFNWIMRNRYCCVWS